MTPDRVALLQSIVRELAAFEASRSTALLRSGTDRIETSVLASGWLATLLNDDAADTSMSTHVRGSMEAVCRQIDVRKKVAGEYGAGFVKVVPEVDADTRVVVAICGALLAQAEREQRRGDALGLGVKFINSTLKALELHPSAEHLPALRAWAVTLLDRHAPRVTP